MNQEKQNVDMLGTDPFMTPLGTDPFTPLWKSKQEAIDGLNDIARGLTKESGKLK
jgi:hypothetical protein